MEDQLLEKQLLEAITISKMRADCLLSHFKKIST